MSEQVKKLIVHSKYQCTIGIDGLFKQFYPGFDWVTGEKIGISYDVTEDVMTVRRIRDSS